MRLLDDSRRNGKHAMLFLIESDADREVAHQIAAALKERPVLQASFVRDVRDAWPTLRLEELD